MLTLLPPRVLRGLLGLLVFLSFDTTALFFFCKREKQTHTHAHTHKRKRYKEFITNEAVPHTTLWLPTPAREPPLSPARSRPSNTPTTNADEFVRRSSSLDSQQPLHPRQHGVLVRVVGLVLGRYLQYRGYGLVVPLDKVPDLVCNVLGDDDDRNVLALGEAREGRLDLLRRCLCDAMRSNTEYFFLGGGRNEVRSELLGDAFLAIVLTRVDDEEVRVLPVVLVPDAREEEPRHRVLSGARESCYCGWRARV